MIDEHDWDEATEVTHVAARDTIPCPPPHCDGPELAACSGCSALHEAHDGIGGNLCGVCLASDEERREP